MKKLLASVLLFFIGIAAALAAQNDTSFSPVTPARPLVNFNLQRAPQGVLTNQDLQGHWTLLFFGFTRCATICPTTLTQLNEAYLQLKASRKTLPQIIFVSIDPARDTPAVVARYVTVFNPAFQGVTGSVKQLEPLKRQLGVLALKTQGKNENDYNIDHSGTIYLINPQGNLQGVFSMPHSAPEIIKGYEGVVG